MDASQFALAVSHGLGSKPRNMLICRETHIQVEAANLDINVSDPLHITH